MKHREDKGDHDDWAYKLFVEYPHLFLPNLESLLEQSEIEVEGLFRIFGKFHVNKEARILDLSCGIGRHAVWLAKKGYEVVGYDPSPFYLNRARQLVKEEFGDNPTRVRFYAGKMENLQDIMCANGEGGFEAIISLYNSIGYTHFDNDFRLFSDALDLASNGGILVTETENRDWRLRNYSACSNQDYGKIEVIENWEFDLETSTSISRSRFYQRDSKPDRLNLVLDLPTRMRLYSLHELICLIRRSGWTYKRSFDSLFDLKPPSLNSANIVTVSKKI